MIIRRVSSCWRLPFFEFITMFKKLDSILSNLEAVVGNTPIHRLQTDKVDLFCKLEFLGFSGSIKDRTAFFVLKNGIKSGMIGPDSTIIESSSGNFAIALATLCKPLGIKFHAVIDPNITNIYESVLDISCHTVTKVITLDSQGGGYQRARIARVQDLVNQIPNSYWPNQYSNPTCMEAHYQSTAGEICKQIDSLDYAFIGVSSGGTIAGISNRLKEQYPKIKIIAVDAIGSQIFSNKVKRRHIPGIGSASRPELIDKAIIDEVVQISELSTLDGCHSLLLNHGIFGGGSTGTVFAAVQEYFNQYHGRKKPKVFILSADRGHAYLDTVYNQKWCDWLKAEHDNEI